MHHSIKSAKTLLAAAIVLSLGATNAWALTLDEARDQVRSHAKEQRADDSEALVALESLTQKGVPVDHAYAVVKRGVDQGIRGKEFQAIVRDMEKEHARGVPSHEARDHALTRVRESARDHAVRKDDARMEIRSQTRSERPEASGGSGMGGGAGGFGGGGGGGSGSGGRWR